MLKRLFALLALFCALLTFAGCNTSIRNTVEGQEATLPPLRVDSTLICSVTSVEGNRCAAVVLEGNNNYEKDDIVYITYNAVAKKLTPRVGDVITFTYNYVTGVSTYNKKPHIQTEEITIIDDYVPPATEAVDAEAETE